MKKSYKGFPIYALIIIGVLIATQLFSSSFSSQRGQKIEAAKLFEYIDSGVIGRRRAGKQHGLRAHEGELHSAFRVFQCGV